MRFVTSLAFVFVALSGLGAGLAHGQGAALDDSSNKPSSSTTSTVEPAAAPNTPEVAEKVQYGFDIRLRQVYVPSFLLELFLDKVPGGTSDTGFGADFVRRRGHSEIQVGFEYEHITAAQGVYVNKGDINNLGPNGAATDYILSPSTSNQTFGWFTLDFTFINHTQIWKWISLRYGGGAGLGIITGKILRYKDYCSGTTIDTCVPPQQGGTATNDTADLPNQPGPYNVPPVFPVVNAIIGLRFEPIDKLVINVETGIRTIPFIGLSAGYFF